MAIRSTRSGAAFAVLAVIACSVAHAIDWRPVTPEDLQLKSVPEAPGAPAVYLYQQVDRDDSDSFENVYVRIKILTDEGRKYGDVEIRYVKNVEAIHDLEARSIRPDGTVLKFSGTVYDKPIVGNRDAKLMAKTFTLPEVTTGSIIEYHYTKRLPYYVLYNSRWMLSQDLFLREGAFSLKRYPYDSLRWSWPNGLPPGTAEPRAVNQKIALVVHNVPAFVKEDHMPPEANARYRVDFIYTAENIEKDPNVFWKKMGKEMYVYVARFIDKDRAMKEALAQIVLPGDDPATRLHKIYARVQRMRNLSFERERTEEERKREHLKNADDVADVWKANAGSQGELNWLFLALARTAGIAADPVLVATRDEIFFDPRVMNPRQLDTTLVVAKLDGKDVFFTPGTPFTPFGTLPWYVTDTSAFRIEKDGGSFIATPLPPSSDSHTEREAHFKLVDGALEGTLHVKYTGLEANSRRLSERNEDDTERHQSLEQEISDAIPTGSEVKLVSSPDWNGIDTPLEAEFNVRVPGWGSVAGHRVLLPVGLFGAEDRHTFEHTERVHPVYFEFPCRYLDTITIELPPGLKVDSVPGPHSVDMGGVTFKASAEKTDAGLILTRDLTRNTYFAPVKYYPPLQHFYQQVRSSDEEQVVLSAARN